MISTPFALVSAPVPASISAPVFYSEKLAQLPGAAASLNPAALGFASGLAVLSKFFELMAQEGSTVDTRRMISDSAYALDQLALAHTSGQAALRETALRLFRIYSE